MRNSILLLFCLLTLLKQSTGQSNYLNFNTNDLEHYALNLIKQQPDSASYFLEDLSKKYAGEHKMDFESICQVYQAQAMLEKDHAEDAKQLLNNVMNQKDINLAASLKCIIYKLLGKIEFQYGRFFASSQYYKSSLELAKSIHNNDMIAEVNEELAKIFDKINRTDKALQFYLRSLKLYTGLGKQESMQTCALALARLYLAENKLDSAYLFINQSISLSQILNNNPSLIESLVEESNVYLKKKEFNATSENIRKINKLMENESIPFLKVRQYVLMGNYAMLTQGDSTAKEWYSKAEEYSHKGFTPFIDFYIKSNIADSYYAIGNIEKAYSFLKYTEKIGDSYSSKENGAFANDIRQNSELNIRDREIEFLRIQNQLKQEKIEKELEIQQGLNRENILKDQTLQQELLLNEANTLAQKLQQDQLEKEKIISQSLLDENELKKITLLEEKKRQTLLWIGIGILLGLGVLISYLFKKQKEKNAIILKQTKDLEFINKEVHHRVKNNLQVISSLLDLQSQANPDSIVSNVLRESKHRVQSMAFIHQNLYEGEGMNQVDMPSYVKNLVDHLKTTFQKDSTHTDVLTSIDSMRLHMDTVVSVGMIINELVTNSLKYAFLGKEEGTIHVILQDLQNNILLTVADDGHGIPDNIDVSTIKSFGYKMIRAFTQKLKGKLTIENEGGTKVQILFPKK